MKVRECTNRVPYGNLAGLVVQIPDGRRKRLRYYSGGMAWLFEPDRWSGKLELIDAPDILDWCVAGEDNLLMEGDSVYVTSKQLGATSSLMCVTRVKEGDGCPYPIEVKDDTGQWHQINWSEVRGIVKKPLGKGGKTE